MKKQILQIIALSLSFAHATEPADQHSMVEIQCELKPLPHSKIHRNEKFATANTIQSVSTNWSGYVAATSLQQPAQDSITYAAGSWIIPSLSPTPDTSYCAIWVGIDGFSNGTVEQLGTLHEWVDGVQQNYAWFEMYPENSFEISGFPVDIGDQISVRIGYKGDNTFKLVMFNYTQGVTTTIPSTSTMSSTAQRSSAEWVVEAPYLNGVLPLSDFKLATFNYCSAIINGVSGSISNGAWQNDEITMESSTGAVEAQPSVLLKNGNCFTVTWKSE